MALELRQQRSNFSQFSDNLWLLATDGDATIKFDVYQEEMLDFALHLLDVAHDCLTKSKSGTDEAQAALEQAMEAIDSVNKSV